MIPMIPMTPIIILGSAIFILLMTAITLGSIALARHGNELPPIFNLYNVGTTQNGPIFTRSNPFRIGAHVYVMESTDRSDMDWYGTVIGMSDHMVMVRDDDTFVTAHVNKDQVFGVK